MIKVLVKKLKPSVKLPSYKTDGASGMDLMADIDKSIGSFIQAIRAMPDAPFVLYDGNLAEEFNFLTKTLIISLND